MISKNILLFTFLTIFLSLGCYAQEERKVSARLERETIEQQFIIKAFATNTTPVYKELNYLLVSIKKGNGGNLSNNRQSGKFTINPNEVKKLSELSVNLETKDALKVFLYIRDEESQKLIAKDSLEINQEAFSKKASKIEDEVFSELKGLTIDETKTKVGKDFYDLFYMQYNQVPKKDNATITISEVPTRGVNGQINIEIEDKVIYSFMTNPSEDYLKEQMLMSFRLIKEFIAKKNLIKNEFIY